MNQGVSALPARPKPATVPNPQEFAAPSSATPTPSRSRTAVLVVNLGTPSSPNASSLRRYLAEFLGDHRVVEVPRLLWFPILYGVILPLRAPRVAKLYKHIWMDGGSPLRVHSERLTAALGAVFPDADVRLAMRYGEPSVPKVLRELRAAGMTKLVVLPLYPQYSATTTGSVFDAVAKELLCWRNVPELSFVADYHAEPAWIEAIAASIRAHREKNPGGEHLLFSFHGIPQRYVAAGDPYAGQCRASAQRIAESLGLRDEEWTLSYQSRVGREPWLQPYTDETVRKLAERGIRTLDVVCPGFAADCLETLEEIAIQNAGFFTEAGGEALRYVPALNDSAAHVEALAAVLRDRA
jgi:ferrochelatase